MKTAVLFSIFFLSSLVHAASCCGGGSSFPTLIMGDDKAQYTSTFSSGRVSDEVLGSGKWIKRQDGNSTQTLKLDAATLISDKWQTGFSLPFLQKTSAQAQTASGIGDLSLNLAHETFPESIYSRWIPKGLTFLQLTLPTSPSVYDASPIATTEIRGRGFWSLGFGMALQKTWRIWDAHLYSEVHRSLARDTISPGWGTSHTLGAGWNHGDFRLGSALTFFYEDPIKIQNEVASQSEAQKNFTLNLVGSFMLTPESALSVSYADQSLIGTPLNSSLTKTINLSYQHRWPR